MAVDYLAIRNAVMDKVSGTGRFQTVIDHDPLQAPTDDGLVAALIGIDDAPAPAISGLASMSMRVELVVRVMLRGMLEPQGFIDPEVFGAADAVMGALAADTRLGGLAGVYAVDLFGQGGDRMRSVAGWVDIQQTKFRIADVYIPILINDAWDVG